MKFAPYPLTKTRAAAQPKLNEVSRLVAGRAGCLGRKGDGKPSAQTLWKGASTENCLVPYLLRCD